MEEGEEGEREKKSSRRSERRVEWVAEGRGMEKISPARPEEGVFWKEMVGVEVGVGVDMVVVGRVVRGGKGVGVCEKGSVRKGSG